MFSKYDTFYLQNFNFKKKKKKKRNKYITPRQYFHKIPLVLIFGLPLKLHC